MAIFATKERKLSVEIPSPRADRALTSKVGVVAVAGFALGFLWPRIFDLKVGPDVPSGATPKGLSKPAAAPMPGPSDTAPVADLAAEEDLPETASATNKQTVLIGDGRVEGCKNKRGEKVDECGKVSFDKVAKERLAELARCPAALGLSGKMSLALTLNFEKNEVVVDGERKKSGLPSDTVKGVVLCAGKELKGVELEKIRHTHPRYTLVYDLAFYPPGEAPAAESAASDGEPAEEGLGRASVRYEKGLVREQPDSEAKIVARLPQGTRVKLVEQKGDWFRVESGKKKGWIYRQAIGK